MGEVLHGDGRNRVVIEGVTPSVDDGRFPAKRTAGDLVHVEADIFADGHDSLAAILLSKREASADWTEKRMRPGVNDRWAGDFSVPDVGRYVFTIRAWVDHFETWRRDLLKRIEANNDTDVDYRIGGALILDAAARASGWDAQWLTGRAHTLNSGVPVAQLRPLALDNLLNDFMLRYSDRRFASAAEREYVVVVDPLRARFSAWYELFPRSTSPVEGRHGTLADCIQRLPYVAAMGFDIVYLPPIHPIGRQFRKGPNNSTAANPEDPGSPWAIGASEGGHKSINPELGTLEDFRVLVARASELGLDVALDIAFQASPDHPYVEEHEEWFQKRPDGSIQYAENPPKKYQDIYPFDFESDNWRGLWEELRGVFLFWIDQGVRVFRVDNPHTKPLPFWEWVIGEVKQKCPETIFLSEAFTRPKIMYRLAKAGFSQSYTYFPWRNVKYELVSYLTELTKTEVREYFRPNHWPNTPDILTEFLQTSGRPGFVIRLLLAATLGANYGIYGPAFELLESKAVRPGSEEYLDSEKYQVRYWNLERADSLRDLITLVNRIRRENAALQNDWSLDFHTTDNDQLICYSKRSDDGQDLIVVVVNLDPHHAQSGYIDIPLERFGVDRPFQAHELLTGARYIWSGARNLVQLDPASVPGHIFRVRRRVRSEADFEYFL
ncbi:MAG TPA: alpha-1,4-glucan--maltose-1-phosphate maltosyltransferase [Bryobacteraceae bacterium]|nr:alpha-1,4-glucan--maltose-1-phosphate maltosyltransferase [Bryobacteraceae bacterium]